MPVAIEKLEEALLSAVYLEHFADAAKKRRFLESISDVLDVRDSELDEIFFSSKGHRMEADLLNSVLNARAAVFDSRLTTECIRRIQLHSVLFRDCGSMDLGEIVGPESGGFFDYWETPPPAYWIDYRFFPKGNRPDPWTILVSWIPAHLVSRAREWSEVSTTGELTWAEDVLANPRMYDVALDNLAGELAMRIRGLAGLA